MQQQQQQHSRSGPSLQQQQQPFASAPLANQGNFDRFEYAPFGSAQRQQPPPTSATPAPASNLLSSPVTTAPRVPLSDRDLYMLSLPSQDKPSYYDPSESSSSETDGPLGPLTSNRGNKLHSSARNARRGRLGSYPHTDIGFPSTSSSKRRKTLEGHLALSRGFAIAPNLHLIPRRSPSPPAQAVLPPPPQSPLDLLLSTAVQHTFGPKNATLKTLAMSATGLIEQEGALIGSLRRVCAGLRGEGFEFRWEGDEEAKREREIEEEKEMQRHEVEQERLAKLAATRVKAEAMALAEEERRLAAIAEAEAASASAAAAAVALAEQEAAQAVAERIASEAIVPEHVDEIMEDASAATITTLPTESVIDPTPAPTTATESAPASELVPKSAEKSAVSPVEAIDEAVTAVKADGDITMQEVEPIVIAEVVEGEFEADATKTTAVVVSDVVEVNQAIPQEVGEIKPNGEAPTVEVNHADDGEGELIVEGEEGHDSEEPTRRRSGRVASRAGDPTRARSGSTSTESDEPIAAPLGTRFEGAWARGRGVADEEMPEYAKRMVDPEVYVRSLFVTEGVVGVPVSIQGGPPGSTDVDLLSPNEQEVMVHDCLTDLHRFMADSLEYRSRLSEIRDGVLGVERRRKGMWKLIRMISSDWLEEESAAHENE